MERGLLAPLSLDEVITLRRIAHGKVGAADLKKQDVDHLTMLKLVCVCAGALALTALGERRIALLPKHFLKPATLSDDEYAAALAKALGVQR